MRGGSTCVTRRRESRSPRGSLLLSRLHQSRTPATTARSNERITMGCSRDRSGSTRFLGPEASEGKVDISPGSTSNHHGADFSSTSKDGSSLLRKSAAEDATDMCQGQLQARTSRPGIFADSSLGREQTGQGCVATRHGLAQEVCQAAYVRSMGAAKSSTRSLCGLVLHHARSIPFSSTRRQRVQPCGVLGATWNDHAMVRTLSARIGLGSFFCGRCVLDSRTGSKKTRILVRLHEGAVAQYVPALRGTLLANTQGKEGAC